jgi:hypothetical protein
MKAVKISLEGKMERVAMPFLPRISRISRIEKDFTDKMGLIDQISGSPHW